MKSQSKANHINSWRLRSIEIASLFGKYDFDAIELGKDSQNPELVNFLYGDNGTGKTTILNIIYSLLSSEKGAGNKSYLASIEFRRVKLFFANGSYISASRKKVSIGSYVLEASCNSIVKKCQANVNDENRIKLADNEGLGEFLEFVDERFPSVVIVSDLRTFRASDKKVRSRISQQVPANTSYDAVDIEVMVRSNREKLEELSRLGLSRTLQMARNYLSARALRSSVAASQSAGNLYLRIADSIVKQDRSNESERGLSGLRQTINDILPDIRKFQTLGFRDGDSLPKLQAILETVPEDKVEQLVDLLAPYVDSLQERLDQNRPLYELIERYRSHLNSYLRDKSAIISVGKPITFFDHLKNELQPTQLSSGERHIVHLLTVCLLSNQSNCIILIDEPELSLNHKWQSRLVESLVDIAGATSQFVLATHSFEIIAGNRSAIRPIKPAKAARA